MPLNEETLREAEEVRRRYEAAKSQDKRAVICSCGHPMGKHAEFRGAWSCNANVATCPCREPRETLKAPNARAFSFKTDESGHALTKGISKASAMGHAELLDWATTCVDCGEAPVTVKAVDGGRRNEPRCGVHR